MPLERSGMVQGSTVLLVDDVFITNATAKYSAKALRAAGARRVFFVSHALGGKGGR